MQLYFYDQDTKEYISTREAVKDPIEGKDLIPGNATILKPPDCNDNQKIVQLKTCVAKHLL